MRWGAVACVAALVLGLPPPCLAQDTEAEPAPSAEEMIEIARETWRSPGLHRRCTPPEPGEIVVCAPDSEEFRVESPTDEAIRKGERPPGLPPNAMHLFEPPPCVPSLLSFCGKFGKAAVPPSRIDLTRLPEPLTPEEAARILRAEDAPDGAAMPAAASPAAAP
jgi:hypothetical protein